MKIRLMQITHDLAIGGLQQVVVNICRTINREKFDISVLCLRALGEFVPEVESLGIKVHFLPQKKRGTDYFSFLKVAEILRRERIEVIHTHNTQPFVDGTIAAQLSGVKTVVHTDHARDFPDKLRYMIAEHLMSYFAYRVVGVSEHTSNNLVKYEKISPRKVITIENGIDGTRFEIEIDRERKRKELGLSVNGPIIGLGVRLVKLKGITFLLQAMPEIIKAHPDVMLLIAGDGELKDALQQESQCLGIEGHVRFLGGRLDIPELLKLFDVYVLPSLSEGMPMVLLEAMAAGCPIVATDVGGVSKVVRNGENGLLVKARHPGQLAVAVNRLLNDEALRSRFVSKGKDDFSRKFSAEIMTRHYEDLYLRKLE
jgi:glycosyltransferase involved in cell wall biosynthesis